jgi:hypothetical protein
MLTITGILAFVRGMHLMRFTIMYGDYMHKITLYQQHTSTLGLITVFWDVMPFSVVNEYQSWKHPDVHI